MLLTCSAARLLALPQRLNALHVQALKPLKVAFRRPCHLACMLACGMTPRAWRSRRQAMLLHICLHTGQLHSFLDLMLMDSEDAELERCHNIGLARTDTWMLVEAVWHATLHVHRIQGVLRRCR